MFCMLRVFSDIASETRNIWVELSEELKFSIFFKLLGVFIHLRTTKHEIHLGFIKIFKQITKISEMPH